MLQNLAKRVKKGFNLEAAKDANIKAMQLVTGCLGQKVLDSKPNFHYQLRTLCRGVMTDRLLSHGDPLLVQSIAADNFFERVKIEPSNETAVRPGRRKRRGHAPTRKTIVIDLCE